MLFKTIEAFYIAIFFLFQKKYIIKEQVTDSYKSQITINYFSSSFTLNV